MWKIGSKFTRQRVADPGLSNPNGACSTIKARIAGTRLNQKIVLKWYFLSKD
jgi:hypothetical protein